MKKVLAKFGKIIKTKLDTEHHPHDIKLEKIESESALAEIELRDR